MKKTNYLMIGIILILTIILIITIIIINASGDIIAMRQIKKITYGMSEKDVIDLLGDRKSSHLSGAVRNDWELANGDTIIIYFDRSEETEELYVTGFIFE